MYRRLWYDEAEQARGVRAFVEYVAGHGVPYGEILVMCPARPMARLICEELADLPNRSYFTEEALLEREAQEAYTILTLAAHPRDRAALRCWLGAWRDDQNAAQYAVLRQRCEEHNIDPIDILASLADGSLKLPGTERLVARLGELRRRLDPLSQLTGSDLIDALLPPSQPWAELARNAIAMYRIDGLDANALHRILAAAVLRPRGATEGRPHTRHEPAQGKGPHRARRCRQRLSGRARAILVQPQEDGPDQG